MVEAPAYRAEIWQLPHETPWGKIIPRLKYTDLVCQIEKDDVGYGRIIFVGDDDQISKIIDTANGHGSIVRIFDDQNYNAHTFYSEFLDQTYEEQGQTVVHGPGIGNALDKMVVHPKDGLDDPEVERWIWDGNDSIKERTIDDLGEIKAEWELWLDGERYGLSISATGGTWELAVPGHGTTTPLQWDASAGSIKSALENLTGITEVDVIKHEDDSYNIIFNTPKDLTSGDMTAASIDLTGGTVDLTKQADGFDTSTNPTFTITVVTDEGSDTTEALAWNASENTLEGTSETLSPPGSGLQGLTNVDDVTVQGKGTYADRWVVTFHIPAIITSVSITFAAGTAGAEETEQGRLNPSPITKSISPDATFAPHTHGTYGTPEIEVVTSPLNTDSDWTLLVRALSQFSGSQMLLGGLTPGQIYQASVPVYPTKTGKYRLVMRDESENLIKWTNVTLTAGSYQVVTVPDVIPSTEQVLFRIAVVSESEDEVGDFYVDWQHAKFTEGDPPTTIGDILQTIIAPIQERGVVTWLDVSTFDAVNTSGGVPWDSSTRGLEIPPGQTVLQLMDAITDLWGYEWGVVWDETLEAYALKVYNRDGMGTDRTGTLTFHPRQGWKPTVYQESLPPYTAVLAEANPGVWGYKEDTTLSAAYGKTEGSLASSGVGLQGGSDVEDWLTEDLAMVTRHRFSARANLGARNDLRLGGAWNIGDKVNFAFSSTHIGTKSERINSVQLRVDSSDEQNVEYSIDYVKPVLWEPEAGTTSAPTSYMLNKLLRKFRRQIVPTTSGPIAIGTGGGKHIDVAAFDAPEWEKASARYICDGIDDHEEIMAAAADLLNLRGMIALSSGQFNISTNKIDFSVIEGVVGHEVHLQGRGLRSTELVTEDTSGSMIGVGNFSVVSDLTLRGNFGDGIGIGATQFDVGIGIGGDRVIVRNVNFLNLEEAFRLSGEYWTIMGCTYDGNLQHWIVDQSLFMGTKIVGNHIGGRIDMGQGIDWLIANNVINAVIEANSPSGFSINGNVFVNPSVGGVNFVTAATRGIIANNVMADLQGGVGVSIENGLDVKIHGNHIHEGDVGVRVIGGTLMSVRGNTIRAANGHGVHLTDAMDSRVMDNEIYEWGQQAVDTYDGVLVDGTSDHVRVSYNSFKPASPRSGVNIANGNYHIVAENDFGLESAYSVSPVTPGAGTRLFVPSDSVYGSNFVEGASDDGTKGLDNRSDAFSSPGSLAVGVGKSRLPFPEAATIISIRAMVDTAPTGADVIIDVNKNGTTLFTTQANRPTITAATTDSGNAVPDVVEVAAGDYLTVDVDQVGSTTPGSDLTVIVVYES